MLHINCLPKPPLPPVSVYAGDNFVNMVPIALLGSAISLATAEPCMHIKIFYAGDTYVVNRAVAIALLSQLAETGTAHIHTKGECICVEEDQLLQVFETLRTESMYVSDRRIICLGARE